MRSVKPGRGPSIMGCVVGIFMIGCGIVWTIIAAQGSPVFALFGVLWTGIAVVQTIYNFKNTTGKNRYSQFDITDNIEEPDPLNERFGDTQAEHRAGNAESRFCPYCGKAVEDDFAFCNHCGKKLP